jgi:biofilm PGA synthesis N-glycosyltransferase PgaC
MSSQHKLLNVKGKLIVSSIIALTWLLLSIYIAYPWYIHLSSMIGAIPAGLCIIGLALIPGLSNAFLVASMVFDDRPIFDPPDVYPPITILIAAYNEENCIGDTINAIAKQHYPNKITIYVGDDGSIDKTREIVKEKYHQYYDKLHIQIFTAGANQGKGNILNHILKHVETEYTITIDADTYLFKDALKNIVTNIIQGPPNTAAVAGSVLSRNSRKNWLTKVQEWDYYHGIAVVKRIQSLYQGTLVAQGAFSIYQTKVLKELGGWDNTVGEDIVLTWNIRKLGYRVSYAEEAVSFTNVPETYKAFFKQRERWSRGLIEAFKKHPGVIFRRSLSTGFVWLNLTFPFNDTIFMFVFVPGLIAAIFFHCYLVVGLMTLILLPMAVLMNWMIFLKHTKTFRRLGLKVRKNWIGFILYIFFYQIIMTPASLSGYVKEFINFKKSWGTK